jgi:hypothetical protein
MKALLSLSLMVCLFVCGTGCEDDSGDANSSDIGNNGEFYVDTRIAQYNNTGGDSSLPDVITSDGKYLFLSGASLYQSRPSCSGFDTVSTINGPNIRFYYVMADTDFSSLPISYYPTKVYGWADGCDPFGEDNSSTNGSPCDTFCPYDIID